MQRAGESSRSVARTCRHFRISRQAFYRWKRRYKAPGEAGLWDRPRTPHRSPRAFPREVVSKILYLRQHYPFGRGKIADYLKRFHGPSVAASSVHRILARHRMNRLPANQMHRPHTKRWQRYEKPQPGYRLQMDVKFLERIPGTRKRFYQFTAIDDCTRIRVLKVYDACNQSTAIRFVDDVLRRLPFRVRVVQTDNGAEFQSRFHWHLEALDIRHVYIRPRTRTSTARSNAPTGSTTRSSISSWTRTASRTIFTCSTKSFESGRTTTTTTGRMGRSMGRPPTSASSPGRERECRRLRTLQPWIVRTPVTSSASTSPRKPHRWRASGDWVAGLRPPVQNRF